MKVKASSNQQTISQTLLDALLAVLRSYEAYAPQRYYSDDAVLEADEAIKMATE